jgi:hypothetical protein
MENVVYFSDMETAIPLAYTLWVGCPFRLTSQSLNHLLSVSGGHTYHDRSYWALRSIILFLAALGNIP